MAIKSNSLFSMTQKYITKPIPRIEKSTLIILILFFYSFNSPSKIYLKLNDLIETTIDNINTPKTIVKKLKHE